MWAVTHGRHQSWPHGDEGGKDGGPRSREGREQRGGHRPGRALVQGRARGRPREGCSRQNRRGRGPGVGVPGRGGGFGQSEPGSGR